MSKVPYHSISKPHPACWMYSFVLKGQDQLVQASVTDIACGCSHVVLYLDDACSRDDDNSPKRSQLGNATQPGCGLSMGPMVGGRDRGEGP